MNAWIPGAPGTCPFLHGPRSLRPATPIRSASLLCSAALLPSPDCFPPFNTSPVTSVRRWAQRPCLAVNVLLGAPFYLWPADGRSSSLPPPLLCFQEHRPSFTTILLPGEGKVGAGRTVRSCPPPFREFPIFPHFRPPICRNFILTFIIHHSRFKQSSVGMSAGAASTKTINYVCLSPGLRPLLTFWSQS